MSIKQEQTATGATINRDTGDGRFAPKAAKEAPVSLDGFGVPAPRFVLRDPDENPVPFSEAFCEQHGQKLVNDLSALPQVFTTGRMAVLLEDLRSGYPVYQEEAGGNDFEVAVMELRKELSNVPEPEVDRHMEQVLFSVHMEMQHRIDPHLYSQVGNGWADLTPPLDTFDDDESATDYNRSQWMDLTERAAAAAGKARFTH